ncbi:MAG TPA: cytochrome c [Thermoanaerobaculia bacterium]|nr:cytochrome c [Thermoanaerobaculia bacterium]
MSTTIESMRSTPSRVRVVAIDAMLAIAVGAFGMSAFAVGAEHPAYGFGSAASESELGRFVSPLPDGRGLPQGSGSVLEGKSIYQQQCAACHGENLQGGQGDKLTGGRGTLVNDDPKKAPVKTVESYWPYATTLFDYIKRAMPMTAPGSLSDNQVYALTAYILSEAKIVPDDAIMNAETLPKVEMPNRDGFIPDHRPEHFPPVAKTPHQDLAIAPAAK